MRNVIVTGGSRGLGLVIARRLCAVGYRVVAIARKETNELLVAIDEAERTSPGSLRFVPFDLAETGRISAMVKAVRRDVGPIHGLVNNAAVVFDGALALMPTAQIEQLIRVNTLAPIVLTKYVTMADGGGRIVNVASIIGFTGYSGLAVYGATKASMLGFTRSLAREVGRMGINVNAIAPGFMDTGMTDELGDAQRQQIARRSALKRLPAVDDVADGVEFLLGDKAKSVTGTVLTVDAGTTA